MINNEIILHLFPFVGLTKLVVKFRFWGPRLGSGWGEPGNEERLTLSKISGIFAFRPMNRLKVKIIHDKINSEQSLNGKIKYLFNISYKEKHT